MLTDERLILGKGVVGVEEEEKVEAEAETKVEVEEEAPSGEELNGLIENLCNSKAEEFRMLGYEHVTGEDIWSCVSDRYQKSGMPALHQIVNDILSLKTTQFMNWMTMRVYRGDPLL